MHRLTTFCRAFALLSAIGACSAHAAGNVTALVFGGSLRVTGDVIDNAIRIGPGANPDEFELEGLNGTTVNGLVVTTVAGVVRNVKIDLSAGSDELYIEDVLIPRKLEILTGPGADVVDLTDCEVGDTTRIATGSDDDKVVLSTDVFQGRLIVQTDAGDDSISIDLVTAADRVRIANGQGDDDVTIGGSSEFRSKVRVQAIAGNDTISIDDALFGAPAQFTFAGGDDGATFTNATFASRVLVNGGAGIDSFTDGGGNTFALGLSMKKVETLLP
ncbi:MAG: hypothetical protein KIT14_02730 [bacterium]|nr:hypothetical protein [bacterium]